MKTYSLEELTDKYIGKKGTKKRDEFENELRLMDYLIYKEATSKSKVKQADVDKLAKEVKKGWWAKNRKRLIK